MNSPMEMIFRRKWEGAHRFVAGDNRNTLCGQPHGHTWRVQVELLPISEFQMDFHENMMVPFIQAKKQWHAWIDHHIDHSFMFNSKDPLLEFMLRENPQGRHVVMPGDPTTEMVALTFFAKLTAILKGHAPQLRPKRVLIKETATNAIAFSGNPQDYLPQTQSENSFWWNRSDMSTHDLDI